MSEAVERKVLSIIMDFIHNRGHTDLDGFASKLTRRYCGLLKSSHNNVTTVDFLKMLKGIRTNFFVINKVKKADFSEALFSEIAKIELPLSKFSLARDFISRSIEVGYKKSIFAEERKEILSTFGKIKSPHERIMKAFEILLQKITSSFQTSLHGTKEHSGIDISKKIGEAVIGFQIKSVNDDISEDKIRSQASKALEYNIDGFVWIYGRPESKAVESSVQAAYHHFSKINKSEKMYCAIVEPNLLAELFRKYEITV